MKRIKIIIISLIIFLFCFAEIGFSAEDMFTLGTGGSGGTMYYIGSAMSNFLSPKLDNMDLRAVVSGGTNINIRLLGEGDLDFATCMILALKPAYEGEGAWKENPQKNLRAIMRLHASVIHYVVRKDSGIKRLEDLRVTKGNADVLGGTTSTFHENIFEFVGHDQNVKEIPAEHVSYSEAVSLIRDGHIKWALFGGNIPEANTMEISSTREIDLLDIDGELREKITKEFPYYFPWVIPAGSYKGIDRDVETIGAGAVLVVNASVAEDVVYELTKAIFENINDIRKLHSGLNNLSLDTAMGSGYGVPFHPGAEKYYREEGLIK